MTVKVSKPAINIREKLSELEKPSGIAGEALLRADTVQEVRDSIRAGRKNLIINGAMNVSQRGTSTTGITANASDFYACDRVKLYNAGGAGPTYTVSQEADGPPGFNNSYKIITTTADTTLPSAHYTIIRLGIIEGQDLMRSKFGTSEAESLTASFWVKSNKTGKQTVLFVAHDAVQLQSGGTFEIHSSGVWEKKTVTVPGNTVTAWADNTSQAFTLDLFIAAGSSYMGGAAVGPVWGARTANTKAVDNLAIADATNNYFQITGVQLELGSVATDFEHRSYGEELALCQRYCYVIGHPSQVIYLGTGSMYTSTAVNLSVPLPVQLRSTSPSFSRVTNGTGNWLNVYVGATGTVSNASPLQGDYTQSNLRIYIPGAHSGSSPSAPGAGVWSMVLAGAKLIISSEL